MSIFVNIHLEAWYTAANNATVTAVDNISAGTLSVGNSTATAVNGFTITPSYSATGTTVAYTNSSGSTFVSVPDGNGGYYEKEASLGNSVTAAATFTLKATVSYSGDLTTKAAVQALWETTVSNVRVTISCSEVGGSTVSGSAATSDVKGCSNANASSSGNLYAQLSTVVDETSQFVFGDVTSGTPNTATTSAITIGTVYVGLAGSNSLIVDSTHLPTYTLKIAAAYNQ